jgi:uncharacterized membrane protein YsdA (DUF1294 family)
VESVLAALTALGSYRLALLGGYAVLSAATFVVYGVDKSAAEHRRWRTPERTLHLLSLAGGWPGALAAQRVFRHKTRKQPFQAIFWCTVIANGVALAWLLSQLPLAPG